MLRLHLTWLVARARDAGDPALVTDALRVVMVDHSGGILRSLVGIGADLLDEAARQQAKQLDGKPDLEVFDRRPSTRRRRARTKEEES